MTTIFHFVEFRPFPPLPSKVEKRCSHVTHAGGLNSWTLHMTVHVLRHTVRLTCRQQEQQYTGFVFDHVPKIGGQDDSAYPGA